MDDIKYRKADQNDIPQLLDLRHDFSLELVGEMDLQLTSTLRESMNDYLLRELNHQYIVWVATNATRIVSTAAFVVRTQPGNPKNPSGIWAYVMCVYTLPEYRRLGYSENVMKNLLETAKEMGIKAIELHATKLGAPGYEKLGFNIHPEPTYRLYL